MIKRWKPLIGTFNLVAGHVFAFGESRALAIANMVLGLKEIQIRGEIRTNVDYTIDLLHVRFLNHFPQLFQVNTTEFVLQQTILGRLLSTGRTGYTQVGWTVELLCGSELKGHLGTCLLLEGRYM